MWTTQMGDMEHVQPLDLTRGTTCSGTMNKIEIGSVGSSPTTYKDMQYKVPSLIMKFISNKYHVVP